MPLKRRPFSIFTLSFLDVMCCGFGAVVLLFMILKHEAIVKDQVRKVDLGAEVNQLVAELADARTALAAITAQMKTDAVALAQINEASDAARKALEAARATAAPGTGPAATRQDVATLRAAVRKLELERKALLSELNEKSNQVRSHAGDGNREYLTGIRMNGRRTLILLDSSASMLDETIANVLRRRNLEGDAHLRAEKWMQAVDTVDWITARLPQGSEFQVYAFGEEVTPILEGTRGRWLSTDDKAALAATISAVRGLRPQGGSNLAKALQVVRTLQPQADNAFLITDGLPTQGLSGNRRTRVSGEQRVQYFEEARSQLPGGTPMNVILLPMEGDPMAPWAYWGLAMASRGSFLTPAYDWP
jgi:hypothetical protein